VQVIVLGAALVLLIVVAARLLWPASEGPAPGQPAAAVQPGDPEEATDLPLPQGEGLRRLSVLVYFPSAVTHGLIGEPREIFETTAPGDRAKRILADLISGPETELALTALPPGTRLRQVYVLEQGTAFVDFSIDLKRGLGGGSTEELFTVYSIVNSLTLNIPEIRRVGILINGVPVETLNGHLDLRRPLPPDSSIIAVEAMPMIVDLAPAGGVSSPLTEART
jgi:hypothetical protein